MESWVNGWMIFRDQAIKAIVVSYLVCVVQNVTSDKSFLGWKATWAAQRGTLQSQISLFRIKKHVRPVWVSLGLSWSPLPPLPSLLCSSPPSSSVPTSPSHVRHARESYPGIRFLCSVSKMLTSTWTKCKVSAKQTSQGVPSTVICSGSHCELGLLQDLVGSLVRKYSLVSSGAHTESQ